jgi:uncharacterized lipoprotein YddW (UPF0748 family)
MKAAVLAALLALPDRGEVRAVWVTRHEYRTEADVRSVISNCASLGFNTIFLQVRGQADAHYRSRLEPWGAGIGGADPGFDPLDVACREARRRGIALHAWMNVMPAWSGRAAPPRDHVAARKPSWLLGGRGGDGYVFVDPRLAAVRAHLAAVARDIVSRYAVDGLHLDYLRFPEGEAGGEAPARRAAVTETLRGIGRAARDASPGVALTAAVFATARGRREVSQDAEEWVREGWVDRVFPMTYNADDGEHRRELEEAYAAFGREACVPGIGVYKHATAEQTVRQVRMSRSGFALFSYSSLFAPADRMARARREALRRALAE